MGLETPPTESVRDVGHYLSAFRSHKWTIAAVTVAGLGIATLLAMRQSSTFSSAATVLVNAGEDAQATDRLQTEARIASSTAVANLAKDRLASPKPAEDLLKNVTVSVPPDTTLMVITYSDSDALAAQRGAEAFAESYLELKDTLAREANEVARQQYLERRTGLRDQLARANRAIARSEEGSAEQLDAQARASFLEAQISNVEDQLQLLSSEVIDPGQVISPPVLPKDGSNPRRNIILAGLLMGLILGCVLALLRVAFSKRVTGRDELERLLDAPTLAMVPAVSTRRPRDLTMVVAPLSMAAEGYRNLRVGVLQAAAKHDWRSILITSGLPGEGKSSTAANLAVALVEVGKRVILVSADLRRPRLHTFFGADNEPGLAERLTGEALADMVTPDGYPNLRILPSGRPPPNPAELLQGSSFSALLKDLRDAADFVIVDSPPLVVSDALVMAPFVDAVLLVADARRASEASIVYARTMLERSDVPILGAVLTNVRSREARATYGDQSFPYTDSETYVRTWSRSLTPSGRSSGPPADVPR